MNSSEMKKQRLHQLSELYLDKKLSSAEEAELMQLLSDPSNDDERMALVTEYYDKLPESFNLGSDDSDRIFSRILSHSTDSEGNKPSVKRTTMQPRRIRLMRWTAVAAAGILVFLVFNILRQEKNRHTDEINRVVEVAKPLKEKKPLYKNDIRPGGDQAVLTLADGSKIYLTKSEKGELGRQGGATVVNLGDGKIAYQMPADLANTDTRVIYNSLSTPRGGQYNIVLSDGTVVWLNASTTLKFPVAFAGNERRVEVNGEAYFEVAEDKSKPFLVQAGNQQIKVLGTHFNVSAYADDKLVKTTLFEGKVEISLPLLKNEPAVGNVTLMPGQQSQTDKSNTITVVEADLDEAIGWKNGYFVFSNERLDNIMLKLTRWYDIEVAYEEGYDADARFTGSISRTKNISDILTMLEQTEEVQFMIEEKTITVLK